MPDSLLIQLAIGNRVCSPSSLSILSEIARLMFLRLRSSDTNIIHAHNVILKSSYDTRQLTFSSLDSRSYLSNKLLLFIRRPCVVWIKTMPPLIFCLLVGAPPVLRSYAIIEWVVLIRSMRWLLLVRILGRSRVQVLKNRCLLDIDRDRSHSRYKTGLKILRSNRLIAATQISQAILALKHTFQQHQNPYKQTKMLFSSSPAKNGAIVPLDDNISVDKRCIA